jgi:hypothetical protein
MRELIKKILREELETNDIKSNIQYCSSNKEIKDVLGIFTYWRTGMCNKIILDKILNNIKKYKNEPERLKYYQDQYTYENKKCGSDALRYNKTEYGLKSDQACTESMLSDYMDDRIRGAFNTYMNYRDGCFIFKPETCSETLQSMSSKAVQKLENPNLQKPQELKPVTSLVLQNQPDTLGQKTQKIVDKVKMGASKLAIDAKQKVSDMKKKFGN